MASRKEIADLIAVGEACFRHRVAGKSAVDVHVVPAVGVKDLLPPSAFVCEPSPVGHLARSEVHCRVVELEAVQAQLIQRPA